MLSTLVLLAGLLPPSQADGLSLTDVRLTLGICGPPRPNARLLPGDGDIDYAPVMQWLSSVGPLVAPEVFNGRLVTERGATPLAAAQYAATMRVTG